MEDQTGFRFDADVASYIGMQILSILIITFTLGIALPWALCMRERWKCSHTTVNGRGLQFNGKGGDLMALWIGWFILSCITLGIYSLWVGPKLQKWTTEHTSFATV